MKIVPFDRKSRCIRLFLNLHQFILKLQFLYVSLFVIHWTNRLLVPELLRHNFIMLFPIEEYINILPKRSDIG